MSGEAGPPSREGWWSPLPINSFLNPVPSRGIWAISMSHSVVVQLLSHVRLFAIPWTTAHQASLSVINSWSLLKLMSFESVMPSNHLILCHPILLLPSIFPSIRVFSKDSVLCQSSQSIGASASASVPPINSGLSEKGLPIAEKRRKVKCNILSRAGLC